ncbi:hypothetical protein CDL12_08875 [Handroanthus impetiginosus]|uniref:Myb/SANT-like domain-containing protein n=1 Tax=Handroanthus impetiginosus TaxID=429701 RepID=A0A2G9HLQ4_9LAMI|nr:hypothetical protein CDL12_08875 [Handroanthus impetiginosus]
MECDSKSKHLKRRGDKVEARRRVWTAKEKEALIVALKDAVASGWKCDNGFRTGCLSALEKHMMTVFPGTNICADPHIHSKIHVWKKNHASLVSMISHSGFGWNDSANMIVVEDSVWDNYVKVDPNVRTMRFKSFPFYPSWCDIFGKDRATGEHAQDCQDTAESLLNNNNVEVDDYVPSGFDTNFQPEGSAMKPASTSKKRKSVETSNDDKFFDMMHSFCDRTESHVGEIAKRIGYKYDASKARKAVYNALGGLTELTMSQKIWVAKQLVKNGKDMDLFFSLPNDARAEMVRMILSGAF